METTTSSITESLSSGINSLFSSLFSSLDNSLYAILDDLTFINSDIYNDKYFSILTNSSPDSGLLLIANSLVLGFLIFYTIKLILSNFFSISALERPTEFIFKLLFSAFFMNFSFYLCTLIINIFSTFSLAIRAFGEAIFDCNIDFSTFVTKINIILSFNSSIDIFSLDGMLKSIISFGFFNLIFTYSLRYIMVRVFILLSPFAFISLCHNNTSFIFKAWLKSFISLLFIQIFIAIILLVSYSITTTENILLSKILYIGCVYALIKANTYVKEILGGISTSVQSSFSMFSNN